MLRDAPETVCYFVDEAGDPKLFNGKGRVVAGTDGCSSHFMLGKLHVEEPARLADELESLRAELLASPYFRHVPSMQPGANKTARAFHATDDPPEVRWEVFKLLVSKGNFVQFYAVVRDKRNVLAEVRLQNGQDGAYRYRENDLYDELVGVLFGKLHRTGERVDICFARRGAKNRTKALELALEQARGVFERDYGFRPDTETRITSQNSADNSGLQAVDYYLWALQRFYERGEDRYIELIWPQVGDVHDLDFVENRRRGVVYWRDKPLNTASRAPKNKKRRI